MFALAEMPAYAPVAMRHCNCLDSFLLQSSSAALRAVDIVPFCFPDAEALHPRRPETFQAEEFTFVITDARGSKLYGHCRRVLRCGPGGSADSVVSDAAELQLASAWQRQLSTATFADSAILLLLLERWPLRCAAC
eukprot:19496-Heterococcus_DN1.PRE.1